MGGSSAPGLFGRSFTAANLFAVAGDGSLSVTQIDFALTDQSDGPGTFYASIWTDNAGLPGTEVAGAYWSLSTSNTGMCCSLVSVADIAAVRLTGGQQYFMILGPISITDASNNEWNFNNQGIEGLDLYSPDGGSTWSSNGPGSTLGAFDVLGSAGPTPEPASLFLLGAGLIGILGAHRSAK